ncbi:hypothetical protein N9059_01005 [bacterium]|nr:hypothetical protein [bacterium]
MQTSRSIPTEPNYPHTVCFLILIFGLPGLLSADVAKPETPRIDCVVPAAVQPHEKDPRTIWYDDFDGTPKSYGEGKGPLDDKVAFGMQGNSLLCLYEKGKRGKGGRKVFFGDSPIYVNKAVRRGEKFDVIYWRIYVKHQYGCIGSPDKMSRATSLTSSKWTQAMISHVWSSHDSSLTLDPVRGVQDNRVMTRKYNDFERMKWLGNKPVSTFPIHATEESGYWVLVEARVKLNTPGKSDGINQLWIDGRLECERRGLNFRDNYTKHGINAVFLEAYWNSGSPIMQSRWYDNFIISTKPIGPVACPPNPTVIKTPYHGPGRASGWQVELAADYGGKDVVYRSQKLPPGDRVVISATHGKFVGSLAGKESLTSRENYFLRVRQSSSAGTVSDWSHWHQGFQAK